MPGVETTMAGRNLVVVGGSAGSLPPLTTLVQGLPASFQGCVLIVVHRSSESPGHLARILGRSSKLPVTLAVDGHAIQPGIFVAPPDHHLIVTPDTILVTLGPKEHGFRPAVDALFRSAASAHGSRVIGIVLSGGLDDGMYGLSEIKAKGGLTVVQDPEDAEIPNMPLNAIDHVDVDFILPAVAIPALLHRETRLPSRGDVPMSRTLSDDPQLPGGNTDIARMNAELGPPSGLTCPDCGGALWQIDEGKLVRFECHVGHRYSPESFVIQQDERIEAALWTAVRALEERADLRRRMSSQTEAAGLSAVSTSFAEQAEVAERQANQIRDLLANPATRPPEDLTVELPARRKRARQR